MKIVVSGYYGFGNAGDEALLQALLSELRRLRPRARFVVLSGDPARTAAWHGVEAIPRTNVFAIGRALQGARLFISGGGSLLQDATSPRTVPYYTGLMSLARAFGVPVFVYAQGLGPIRRRALRRLAGNALRQATAVTVRDAASAREAMALGVEPDNVYVTADPVFALSAADGPAIEDGMSAHGHRLLAALPLQPLIGVSLRPLQGRDTRGDDTVPATRSQQLVETLTASLHPLLLQHGIRVVPLPLYPAQDVPLLQSLTALLGSNAIPWPADVAPQELNAADWIALSGRLQLCVTMRLHALIFAAAAGVPIVALADDPKVDAHMAKLGLHAHDSIVDASSLVRQEAGDGVQRLIALFERAWYAREQNRTQLQHVTPTLAARARETAVRAIAVAEGRDVAQAATESDPADCAAAATDSGERVAAEHVAAEHVAAEHAAALAEVLDTAPLSVPGGRASVLGTSVDAVTLADTVAAARHFVAAGRSAHIVTANPELVMRARKDKAVREMLAMADLVVADGIGIVGAARLLGEPVPERVPGVELMQLLLAEADERGWRVFLLGGEPGVADEAAGKIRGMWPGVIVVGAHDGYFDAEQEAVVVRQVVDAAPDIVFVGMGAPRQEIFIARQRSGVYEDIQWNVPLAIGIGGSIDVLAGRVRRAPVIWQKLGVEWLYRLIRQPSRLGRAVVLPKFALLVLFRTVRRNLL